MRVWAIFWILVLAVIGTFTIVNWQVLMAPTEVNLLVAQVAAPLGLVMLGAMGALTLMFLLFLVWLETKALLHTRSTEGLSARLDHVERVLRDEVGRTGSALSPRADTPEPPFKRVG